MLGRLYLTDSKTNSGVFVRSCVDGSLGAFARLSAKTAALNRRTEPCVRDGNVRDQLTPLGVTPGMCCTVLGILSKNAAPELLQSGTQDAHCGPVGFGGATAPSQFRRLLVFNMYSATLVKTELVGNEQSMERSRSLRRGSSMNPSNANTLSRESEADRNLHADSILCSGIGSRTNS